MTGEIVKVRCPACRSTFPPPLQVDRASLEAMVITTSYTCPVCDTASTFHKDDHFFELESNQ